MKIYEQKPEHLIRLTINQSGSKTEYLTLCETNMDDAIEFLHEVVKSNASPVVIGNRTSVVLREADGGKNGKAKSVSFYGLTPLDVKGIIYKLLKVR